MWKCSGRSGEDVAEDPLHKQSPPVPERAHKTKNHTNTSKELPEECIAWKNKVLTANDARNSLESSAQSLSHDFFAIPLSGLSLLL